MKAIDQMAAVARERDLRIGEIGKTGKKAV